MLPLSVLPTPTATSGPGMPSATSAPTSSMPSPGIALAAGRVPVQPTLPDVDPASLSIRMMQINQQGAAEYLLSLYCSTAVLVHDALGVLEGVSIDHFHEYA